MQIIVWAFLQLTKKKPLFSFWQSRTSTTTEKTRSSTVDLNLPPPPPPSFASVCTLEKVKSALERVMGKPNPNSKPGPDSRPDGSMKRSAPSEKATMDGQDSLSGAMTGGAMMMTVCPGCFQYLLVPVADPRCPRCDLQVSAKRAKIGVGCSTSAAN